MGLKDTNTSISKIKNENNSKENKKGMIFKRFFTSDNISPFDEINYVRKSSVIRELDGKVVFEMNDVEVPEGFSQLATDILVSKYFRKAGVPKTGHETSIKQVVFRVAHTLRTEGENQGIFKDEESAQIFEDELSHLLLTQKGAFNSPVWFNAGLYHEYGIQGNSSNWAADPSTREITECTDAYSKPQLSACFIQSVKDDLMDIFELAKNEAKLFKYGSGTGTNFSNIRSKYEKLSGGGTSSGLMSFLEVLDRGAGATKSGGTTRRAAKMVILDMEHPEIVDFIEWKAREEKKAESLMNDGWGAGFEGEAYHTISGQNSNNSVRMSNDFMNAVINNEKWQTRFPTTGKTFETHNAQDLFQKVCEAAWKCADPGVQFHSQINEWHTCPESGEINGSNPCSEFMFMDDSACNLSSINLMKFVDDKGTFHIDEFKSAIRTLITAQEIIVGHASYPTPKIALNSALYRPLGLGYANLGALLMTNSIPYDSEEAFATSAAITALMTAEAYKASAEMASFLGPFAAYEENRDAMLAVMNKHFIHCQRIDKAHAPNELLESALESWGEAIEIGKIHGYRNAQTTLLAPTGTIGLLMDCDTTGIEPDFSLVKFKKLAGGGYFKMINQSIPKALIRLGYNEDQVGDIIDYCMGRGKLEGAPFFREDNKTSKGLWLKNLFSQEELESAQKAIRESQSYDNFTPFINPKSLIEKGFLEDEIQKLQLYINGVQTIEGAPHLSVDHYPIFDCANKCGGGSRYIQPMGHIRMMAAVQLFLSGAISKTVNMPNEATVEDVKNIYLDAWKLGLKSIAIYRDGSKLVQPLTTSSSGSGEITAESGSGKAKTEKTPEKIPQVAKRGDKKSLPIKRKGFTLESSVGGHKIFLRTGEYDDGVLGEIFIDMYKEGAAYRSIINCFAIAVSIGLQYGVPLDKFVNSFTFTRFQPNGMTDHPYIKNSTSILDYIFRVLGFEYLNRTDFLQVKPRIIDEPDDEIYPSPKGSKEKETSTLEARDRVGFDKKPEGPVDPENQVSKSTELLEHQLAEFMGDAPECNICGHLTIRNGTCYKCLNCGNSIGCS